MSEKEITEVVETPPKKQPPKKIPGQSKETSSTSKSKQSEEVSSEGTGFCVYIGPTIGTKLQKGKVFDQPKDEILKQDNIKGLIEEYPELKVLIVSDATLASDRMKLKQPGNLISSTYQKLIKRLKGGNLDD